MNKAIKAIMEKNNIKLTDKKVFRDEYLNGAVDIYELTFAELLNSVGINEAVLYWNGINPYNEDVSLEKELELGLIDKDEYKEMERE